jgi:uncharacterized membrane protein YkoI
MEFMLPIIAAAALCFAGAATADDDVGQSKMAKLVAAGKILPPDQLEAAALSKHPGGRIHKGEVEEKDRGYVYEAEITDNNGVEWDVDIDASNGMVLKDKRD